MQTGTGPYSFGDDPHSNTARSFQMSYYQIQYMCLRVSRGIAPSAPIYSNRSLPVPGLWI